MASITLNVWSRQENRKLMEDGLLFHNRTSYIHIHQVPHCGEPLMGSCIMAHLLQDGLPHQNLRAELTPMKEKIFQNETNSNV